VNTRPEASDTNKIASENFSKGMVFFGRGQFIEASWCYKLASELKPSSALFLVWLGKAYCRCNGHRLGIESLIKALCLVLRNSEALDEAMFNLIYANLNSFDLREILDVIVDLPHEEAVYLLEHCIDEKSPLGKHISKEYSEDLRHDINYKKYMHQPLSMRGLDTLFRPLNIDKVNRDDSLAGKTFTNS